MKSSIWVEATVSTQDEPIESSQDELSSSNQEHNPEVTLNPCRQPQLSSGTFMPYIEGPKMDWTVNGGLCYCGIYGTHRFLKWHLKCKNILECELGSITRKATMLKSNSLVWRLWHGPVCLLGFTNGSTNTRENLEKIWGLL